MKKIIGVFIFFLLVCTSQILSGCGSTSNPTTVFVHDTVVAHYWDPEQTGVTASLISVYFSNLKTGTAVGTGGTIIRTNDGGNTWTGQFSNTSNDLYGVSFSDNSNGLVIGSFGVVLKTTDGGANWNPLNVDIDVQFRNVQMVTPTTAYVIGSRYFDVDNTTGYIYKTTNAGLSWTQLSITSPGLYGISFIHSQTGWVSGFQGVIFKTTDGGNTWVKQTSNIGTDQQAARISFADSLHGMAAVADGIAGVASAPTAGGIAVTSDGGTTWKKTVTGPMDGISMPDPKHAIAVGYNGTVMETGDGGTTWTSKSVGSLRLINIFLNDANNGAMIGENGQLFLLGPH